MYYLADFKQEKKERELGYWQTVGRDTKRGAALGGIVGAGAGLIGGRGVAGKLIGAVPTALIGSLGGGTTGAGIGAIRGAFTNTNKVDKKKKRTILAARLGLGAGVLSQAIPQLRRVSLGGAVVPALGASIYNKLKKED